MKIHRLVLNLRFSLAAVVSTAIVLALSSDGIAAGVGAPAGAAAAGPAAVGPAASAGSGVGNPTGTGVFVPGSINTSAAYNNPLPVSGYSGGGFGGLLGGLAQGLLTPGSPYCPFANPYLGTGTEPNMAYTGSYGNELQDAQFNGMVNTQAYPPNANQHAWGSLGAKFNSKLNGSCQQKFITKDGKLGQWGLETYAQIQNHADSYLKKTPRDMPQFCPKFNSFSPEAKARFYTYLFMSMAQPESTCNPTATGKGPNGTAIGLFQLETPACNRVGVRGSSEQLLQANHNIDCAVALLGSELDKRGTITVGTSRGFGGTYWATLRSDSAARAASSNKIVRGDGVAAKTTASLLSQFEECKSGEDRTKNPVGRVPASR